MRSRRTPVSFASLRECPYCNSMIAFHQMKSGKWIPVLATQDRGQWFKPAGAGNNFNFIPVHDCRGEAERHLEGVLAEVEKSDAQVQQAQACLLALSQTRSDRWQSYRQQKADFANSPTLLTSLRNNTAKAIRSTRNIARGNSILTIPQERRNYIEYLLNRATSTAVFHTAEEMKAAA